MKNITIKSLREKQKNTAVIAENFFSKPKNKKEENEMEERQYRPRKIKKAINFFVFLIFILTVGGTGGIMIDRFVLPYIFIKYPKLNQYELLRTINERTTVIEVTKEVKISEEKAIVEAIKKVHPSVVEITETSKADKNVFYKNPGIILTSDGLILTVVENISDREGLLEVELNSGEKYAAELIHEDKLNKLAIIKINQSNLPVVAFANSDNLELGEKIVMVNGSIITDIVSKIIDDYAISAESENNKTTKQVVQKRVKIMNTLENFSNRFLAINLKGEVVGVSQGDGLLIPINEINKFIEEAMR